MYVTCDDWHVSLFIKIQYVYSLHSTQSAIMILVIGGTVGSIFHHVQVTIPENRRERAESEVQALIRTRGWAKDEPVAAES